MDWRDLVPWLLFLHVLAAIVAIGPNFAYSTIRALGQGEPQHGNFATRVSHAISARLVYPIGLVIPATGIAMILILGLDLTARAFWWLDAAIVIYSGVYLYSFFVQRRIVEQIIELTVVTAGSRYQRPATRTCRAGDSRFAGRHRNVDPPGGGRLPDGREAAVVARLPSAPLSRPIAAVSCGLERHRRAHSTLQRPLHRIRYAVPLRSSAPGSPWSHHRRTIRTPELSRHGGARRSPRAHADGRRRRARCRASRGSA